MNKILLILSGILLFAAVILFEMYNYQTKKVDALQEQKNTLLSNNGLLSSKLEREHNDKIELSEKVEKLEELAKIDTSFNWSADISNTLIVKQLRENANKVR